MTTRRSPPKHLGAKSKAVWRRVMSDYLLDEPSEMLLELACEALDRAEQARGELARSTLTVRDDRGNLRPHPLVAIERDARTSYARLLRELCLDTDLGAGEGTRPPSLRSRG